MAFMAVAAVIFDWGGTLTPWHTLDHEALWHGVCAPHFPEEEVAAVAAAILAAENAFWRQCETAHRSATLDHVFARAGVTPHADLLDAYFRTWEPHTHTDPDVAPLLRELRGPRTSASAVYSCPQQHGTRLRRGGSRCGHHPAQRASAAPRQLVVGHLQACCLRRHRYSGRARPGRENWRKKVGQKLLAVRGAGSLISKDGDGCGAGLTPERGDRPVPRLNLWERRDAACCPTPCGHAPLAHEPSCSGLKSGEQQPGARRTQGRRRLGTCRGGAGSQGGP